MRLIEGTIAVVAIILTCSVIALVVSATVNPPVAHKPITKVATAQAQRDVRRIMWCADHTATIPELAECIHNV
jgi:hypothetical protein